MTQNTSSRTILGRLNDSQLYLTKPAHHLISEATRSLRSSGKEMQVERTPGNTRRSLGTGPGTVAQRGPRGSSEKARLPGEAGDQSSPEASVFVAFGLEDQRAEALGSLECPGGRGLMVARKP